MYSYRNKICKKLIIQHIVSCVKNIDNNYAFVKYSNKELHALMPVLINSLNSVN